MHERSGTNSEGNLQDTQSLHQNSELRDANLPSLERINTAEKAETAGKDEIPMFQTLPELSKPTLGVYYWQNPTRLGNLELLQELRKDFKILLISNEQVDYLSRYADHMIIEKFGNVGDLKTKVRSFKKEQGLAGTITLSEGAVTLQADIAAELGLRGNDPELARFSRNKFNMRRFFNEIGVPSPKSFQVSGLREAIELVRNEFRGKPFFFKAPCIGGSSFCTRVEEPGQLEALWEGYFTESLERTRKDPLFSEMFGPNGERYYMLVEELLGGSVFEYDNLIGPRYPVFEVSVEGFISDGDTYCYSMTDKPLPSAGAINCEEYLWRMHSRIPAPLKEVLSRRVAAINKGLGAVVGCSHTEFRVEECNNAHEADIQVRGKSYRARVIETALRVGGAFMQPAILKATGFNSIRAMAYQACGMSHEEKVLFRFPLIMANLWPMRGGTLARIEGLDRILSLKEKIAGMHLYDSIGDKVEVPPIASRGIGDVLISAGSENLLHVPGWETMSGEGSPYFETERAFLDVVDNFRAIAIDE